MSKKANGVNYGKTMAQKSRRSRVIIMLESQLKRGTKVTKGENEIVPLSEKDIKRINTEIEILKKRVN